MPSDHFIGRASRLASRSAWTLVCTARSPLGVSGEHLFAVEPLPVADAIALFRARARELGRPVHGDDPQLARLVRRLDCLPLAIELAAGRLDLLTPGELLSRLDDRFAVLRPAPGQHGRRSPRGG